MTAFQSIHFWRLEYTSEYTKSISEISNTITITKGIQKYTNKQNYTLIIIIITKMVSIENMNILTN